MNYEFPIIERIEDVLPAIEGRDEFIVAEREGYKVINYNVGFEDTFTIDENDLMENHGKMIPKGIMRRECRGLIFYPDGKIMSRPFHKFFNVGEREETLVHNLDLTAPHVIMEKMDGSMIRPIMVNGKLRLATKMGVTDTSEAAEKIVTAAQLEWMADAMADGLTPLYEFISPENRIVIEYEKAELVMLALRRNRDGIYMDLNYCDPLVRMVPMYGSVDGSFAEYIARQRGREGREGDIIRFSSGHMLKVKNDWYVRIHKVKDKIRTDRHILALVLEGMIDDVMPHLDERDFSRVRDYEARFHEAYRNKLVELDQLIDDLITDAEGDRKRLATEVLPNSGLDKLMWRFVFSRCDGRDLNEMLMGHVKAKLGNTAKYNELAEFLGLDTDVEEAE
jgi:RNA ligase